MTSPRPYTIRLATASDATALRGLAEALRITRGNHFRSGMSMSRRDRVLATLLRPGAVATG